MKKVLITIFCFLSGLYVFAQGTVLTGRVVDINRKPLTGVNIIIENGDQGTQTGAEGNFSIKHVERRQIVLIFSFIGYKTEKIPVHVKDKPVITLPDVVLNEDIRNIGEVVVTNKRKNKFAREESDYVAKLPLKDLENPQVYNSISAELLKEQATTNFEDALKNIPGLQKLWESTGRGSDGAGYYSMRGFAVQPNLVNGLPALTHGSPDPANIERIEAVKGPSGTLYGSSLISYGGLINIVTKKPYPAFGNEVSYLSGSYGLNRITADLNAPLDSARKVLLRINTAYHTENSFQDAGFRKSFFIAPTLSFQASDRLSFLVVTEFMTLEHTNPTMLFLERGAPLTVDNLDDLGYDPERSYTSNNLSIKNPTYNLQAQMNYKLSPSWTSQTALSKSSAKSKGYYSYLYEATRAYSGSLAQGSVFNRYVSDQNTTLDVTDIQQNFIGDFKLGQIRNRIVAGADFMQRDYISNSTGYAQNGIIYIGKEDASTVYQVVYNDKEIVGYDSGVLSEEGMNALLEGSTVSNSTTTEKTFGAYVSDVVNFTPALAIMASLRFDWFMGDSDDDNQTALSPKFGITYQPILEKLALFANYMNGFSNVSPQQVANPDGSNVRTQTYDPERANQYEFGIKTSLLKDRIDATISYYKIKVSDKVMADPDNIHNSIQDGEVESKGFEFDLVANPVAGLNAVAGFSHNDSEILKASSEVGARLMDAGPKNIANLWASYKFQDKTPLNGLGIGFGLNYASENYAINYDATGNFVLPSYTLFNSSIFYESDKYRLAINANNLTDKKYYTGWSTINPQKPRVISANLIFRF